jgi:uncharacterized membrane protein YfhO
MESLRFFLFGASYLFSGVYSLGLSIYMASRLMPVSGYVAMVTVPDALFPYEVVLFTMIGVTLLASGFLEFGKTLRMTQ